MNTPEIAVKRKYIWERIRAMMAANQFIAREVGVTVGDRP